MGMRGKIWLGVLAGVVGATMSSGNVQAQQVPIPQTAAEVPGPTLGPMTPAYVQMVGRMAYLWGRHSSTCITSGRRSRRFLSP
jgi:hypothetical protein